MPNFDENKSGLWAIERGQIDAQELADAQVYADHAREMERLRRVYDNSAALEVEREYRQFMRDVKAGRIVIR